MSASFNEETGDIHVLDNQSGKWIKPKRAENPETGERFYLDGEEWKTVPLSKRERQAGRGTALAQGVLGGFADEAAASAENPLYAIEEVRKAVSPTEWSKWLLGQKSQETPGKEGYDESLKTFRDTERRYAQGAPVESLALNVVGGIPTALATGGVGVARQAATTGGRIAQSAKAGAAYGAAYGYGSGEGGIPQRLESAAGGAAVGGTIGAGFQLLSPLAQPIYRLIKSGTRPLWDATRGTFTTEGREMAIRANMDPAQIERELGEAFAREAQTAANPVEAAALAEARSLPVPVDMPTPYVTGNPAEQIKWDRALQGSSGRSAQQTAEAAETTMRRQMFGNLDAVQGEIAQGGEVLARGQGMANASAAVNRRADTFDAKVDSLWKAARDGGDAGIERTAWLNGVQDIRNAVTNDFTPENVPMVWRVLEKTFGVGNQNADATPLVSKLFQARRELTGLQADGGVEAAAASRAKAALDRWINTTGRQSLEGDPRSIDRWYRAIGGSREFHKKFGSGVVADLIEKDPKAGWRLMIDPQEAATRLLGDGSKALNTKGDLFRDLAQLRSRLGNDSESWRGVRQEIFLRLAREARGGLRADGEYQFSAPKFVKTWDDFLEKNPRLAQMMFSEREFRILRQFRNVATRTIVKPGGRQLGSAAALQSAISQVFPVLARSFRLVGEIPGVKGVINMPNAARANSAAAGTIKRQRLGYGTRNVLTGPAAYQANQD